MNTEPSIILSEAERWLFRLILLVSLFLTVRGHNAPGGGFIGGLVAGAGFTLRFLAGRDTEDDLCGRIRPRVMLGSGLLLAVGTAIAPLFVGDSLLESAVWAAEFPLLGKFKIVSAAIFDLGVYFIVIGFVLTVLVVLGDSGRNEAESRP